MISIKGAGFPDMNERKEYIAEFWTIDIRLRNSILTGIMYPIFQNQLQAPGSFEHPGANCFVALSSD
jgi:hypothetical protein